MRLLSLSRLYLACFDLSCSGENLSGTPKGLLSDGIASVMQPFGFGAGEDVVRLFFRTKVSASLSSLLLFFPKTSFTDILSFPVLAPRTRIRPRPGLDPPSNRSGPIALDPVDVKMAHRGQQGLPREISLLLYLSPISGLTLVAVVLLQTTLRASFRHREEASEKYGILRTESLLEPWTCTPSILDALDHLVTLTETIIRERSREFGSALDEEPVRFGGVAGNADGAGGELSAGQAVQRELKDQLCELGAALCQGFEDRLTHLATCVLRV